MSADTEIQALVRDTLMAAPVPPIDIPRLHQTSARRNDPPLRNGRFTVSFLALSLLLGAAAFATVPHIVQSIRFVVEGSAVRMKPQVFVVNFRPHGLRNTLGELHAKSTYSVVEPAGLPKAARLALLGVADHQMIFLDYPIGRCTRRRCPSSITFILSDARAAGEVNGAKLPPAFMRSPSTTVRTWRSGNERVWIDARGLTFAQIDRIRRAMHGGPMSADSMP